MRTDGAREGTATEPARQRRRQRVGKGMGNTQKAFVLLLVPVVSVLKICDFTNGKFGFYEYPMAPLVELTWLCPPR